MNMKHGEELKRRIMEGRFVIPADCLRFCKGFEIEDKKYKCLIDKSDSDALFTGKDLIVDPVLLKSRPQAALNPFARRIPAELMGYCYQAAKVGKMSFLMTSPDGKSVVFCIDARWVTMPDFYAQLTGLKEWQSLGNDHLENLSTKVWS